MRLLVTNHETFVTLTVTDTGGVRLPTLRRSGGADVIANIVRPQ
jgi:hypothetical protein